MKFTKSKNDPADVLYFVRQTLGLRALDMAGLFGVSPSLWRKWEGGYRDPSYIVEVLCSVLCHKLCQFHDTDLVSCYALGRQLKNEDLNDWLDARLGLFQRSEDVSRKSGRSRGPEGP